MNTARADRPQKPRNCVRGEHSVIHLVNLMFQRVVYVLLVSLAIPQVQSLRCLHVPKVFTANRARTQLFRHKQQTMGLARKVTTARKKRRCLLNVQKVISTIKHSVKVMHLVFPVHPVTYVPNKVWTLTPNQCSAHQVNSVSKEVQSANPVRKVLTVHSVLLTQSPANQVLSTTEPSNKVNPTVSTVHQVTRAPQVWTKTQKTL